MLRDVDTQPGFAKMFACTMGQTACPDALPALRGHRTRFLRDTSVTGRDQLRATCEPASGQHRDSIGTTSGQVAAPRI